MIPIIAAPSLPLVALQHYALGTTDWYLKAVVALWDAGLQTGVDPVVLAAQCGHETGYGRFGGAVDESFGNTCGLKIRNPVADRPEDHARFAIDQWGYPHVGALAHAHHLRLYCGLPVPDDTPDPRAVWIKPGTAGYGAVQMVERLGRRWAPAEDYGVKVADIVRKIQGSWHPE
jgi:N-acetylmuramoyl-L-alanine amidase